MPVRSFEPINPQTDVTTTRTFLHEVIPITASIISGTYVNGDTEENIKDYTHGMFQSVYDYPYLSSSANHIFDITAGYSAESALSGTSAGHIQNSKKINMYNQFAQVLLGYTGSNNDVRQFESDLTLDGVNQMKDVFIISLSRLLVKDEIKKGSFTISVGTGAYATPFDGTVTLGDYTANANGTGVANCDGGDYAILHTSSTANIGETGHGVIFYQAGVVVLTSSVFSSNTSGAAGDGYIDDFGSAHLNTAANLRPDQTLVSSSISGACNALRHRIENIQFNNTTELNSTIYFCRAPTNKFNYSSNPTYTSGSKIRVKNVPSDNPVAYVTTVGLYNAANELLAVAKLSEPLRKSVDNELTIRVRLDY